MVTKEELNFYQAKVNNFYLSEKKHLDYAQARWIDEWQYEDPEDYRNLIRNKAKKYNLEISRITLSKTDFSIKIFIKFTKEVKGIIEIYTEQVITKAVASTNG